MVFSNRPLSDPTNIALESAYPLALMHPHLTNRLRPMTPNFTDEVVNDFD